MLVDSHCHLNLITDTEADILVSTAEKQGVGYFLNVSIDTESFPQLMQTTQSFDNVFASAGIHPNNADKKPIDVNTLVKMADNTKVIAIGETGLDYFRTKNDSQIVKQKQQFRTHIQAAKEINKPLIIHSREAIADILLILQEEQASTVGGIMHCFVEDWETAQKVIDMGFYISFSGIVTFKNAKKLQSVAKKVPLNRLLIETDSPYLAPVPHRGKINQPAYVAHIAKFIANLRDETYDSIAKKTTENFFRLFPIL
ncbi:MAG: TatD family hydrolase [Thiomargarita sp.]|nr:TatD family hydrolase [Thiomargarita sp.]